MKIVAISDTHGKAFVDKIPECDILLHCGDISPVYDHSIHFQKQWFQDTFIPSLKNIPAKHIVFIGGNHDFYLFETYKNKTEKDIHNILPQNVHYLRDSSVTINKIKIHGTPWIPNLNNWAFYANDSQANEHFKLISKSVDILISHGPAFGFCDTILEYKETERLGSDPLLKNILRARPKVVLCGHIHSGNHNREIISTGNKDSICFFNVSLLNEQYDFEYEPKIITINKGEYKWN
jgi:Icc-related predicted phosphoesterase